ncbi:MAG: EscU/YscU/HrcU family type III secretion system export apparatus switch protein [Rhodobacter sp.]|nr:EscU/YscU/HrcU family type III secretion system export apparatus switch protein [Rhodobacter sp.]
MSGDSERKTDPASKRKLLKQREKGVVSQAAEMANYLSQALALLFLMIAGRGLLAAMELGIDGAMQYMAYPVASVFSDAAMDSVRIYLFMAAPVTLLALVSALIAKMIYQKGFVFAIDPVIPKMERINPATGLKRIFGMRGWVELAVSIVALSIWSTVFYVIVSLRLEELLMSMICGLSCFVDIALWLVLLLIVAAILLFMIFAVAEGLVQRFLFANDQKMTKTEVKQERKDQFGSPEVRKERKKLQREMQKEAESTGVDNATMAMFFGDLAVAIRYHPSLAPTPMLAAKSTTAAESRRIRDQIRENGYLETEHQDFVEGMMACRVGKPVPPELHDDLRAALYAMFA